MVDTYICCNQELDLVQVNENDIAPANGWVCLSDYLDLKRIALQLLEKYESAQSDAITELSGKSQEHLNMLVDEIKELRKLIDA